MNSQNTPEESIVTLHLYDGTLEGKLLLTLDNWVGEILQCGKNDREWLLQQEMIQKSGVYLLQGRDSNIEEETKRRIYIGMSNRGITERIRHWETDEKKKFWTTTHLITTSNPLMNDIGGYVESRLIKQAHEANRAHVVNDQMPSPKLSSQLQKAANKFLKNLELLFPIINIDCLKPLQARSETIKDFMFELIHETTKSHAIANENNGDFFVLKNSLVAIEKSRETQTFKNKNFRQELINRGDLEISRDGENYVFTRDVHFSSPSAAASVVINGHAGVREWIIKGTNEDYSHWRDNPSKFSFS